MGFSLVLGRYPHTFHEKTETKANERVEPEEPQ